MPLCSCVAPLALSQPENLLLDKEGFLKVRLSHAAVQSRAAVAGVLTAWRGGVTGAQLIRLLSRL